MSTSRAESIAPDARSSDEPIVLKGPERVIQLEEQNFAHLASDVKEQMNRAGYVLRVTQGMISGYENVDDRFIVGPRISVMYENEVNHNSSSGVYTRYDDKKKTEIFAVSSFYNLQKNRLVYSVWQWNPAIDEATDTKIYYNAGKSTDRNDIVIWLGEFVELNREREKLMREHVAHFQANKKTYVYRHGKRNYIWYALVAAALAIDLAIFVFH